MLYLEARLGGKIARWPLPRKSFVIGRGDAVDVGIDDGSVSRRHLRVEIDDGRIRLEDLGSTNGLRIDGRRVERAEIGPDEWFVVGTVLMTIRQGVSLTSLDDHPRPGAVLRDEAADSPVGGNDDPTTADIHVAGRTAASNTHSLDGLARRIEEASGSDQLLQASLAHLVERSSATGAAVIEKIGNGWVLRGQTGQPLDGDQEDAFLLALEPRRDEGRPVEVGAVVGWPLGGRSGRNDAWLLIHAPACPIDSDPELKLTFSLCGKWLASADDDRSAAGDPDASDTVRDERDGRVFVAVSETCRRMLDELDRLAATDLPVLLRGESGTGKELLSRRLHERSARRAGPFVALNCAALPRDLLEAELFGIEKGVATGVAARPGHFVLASGGTLLLDEIGDMPAELQPKVLRAIESGEVRSLGAPAPVAIDVRIVASTHQDLDAKVEDGSFRRDLYHRVAGAIVQVAPLRDRPEDILPLARAFVVEASRSQGRGCAGFDLQAARQLVGYPWPGNVRELRHVVARAVALADGPVLHVGLFPESVGEAADAERADAYLGLGSDFREARRSFDRLYFTQLLARCDNNLSKASRLAKLNRSHLYKKLTELGLK